MSQTLFISDLHLSEKNTHLNALFDHFIQTTLSNKNIDAVYILGDFFDVWIGDDAMGDWERSIAQKLAALVDHHIPVYIMVGNRDFLLHSSHLSFRRRCKLHRLRSCIMYTLPRLLRLRLAENPIAVSEQESFISQARAVLLQDPTVIELYGKRIILKHGDDLCVADRVYQLFRGFVRLGFVKFCYRAMPLSWRQKIAAKIRQNSSKRGMRPIYAKISSIDVKKLLQKHSADWLIHGHTHCPQIEDVLLENKTGKHIILSDWNQQGNQLVFSSKNEVLLDYFG